MERPLVEKRRCIRVPSRIAISYKVTDCPDCGRSTTLDLSEGGLKAKFNRFLRPSTALTLDLNLKQVISTCGEVVWSQRIPHSDHYAAGIRFLGISDEDRLRLREHIMLNA